MDHHRPDNHQLAGGLQRHQHQSNFVRTLLDALDRLTAPLYRPIRKVMPDFGGIDFSPIVLILAIQILRKLMRDSRWRLARP